MTGRLIVGGAVLGLLLAHANGAAAGVLLLGGLAVAVWALSSRSVPLLGRRRVVRIHTEGSDGPKEAAQHEAGHFVMARHLGWSTGKVRIFPDGSGYTEVHIPRDAKPFEVIALSSAGRFAEGSAVGCGGSILPKKYSDNWNIQQALREVPATERSSERRRGEGLARATVGGWIFDNGVGRYAGRIRSGGIG